MAYKNRINKSSIDGSVLIQDPFSGAVTEMIEKVSKEDARYFALVVMCGHCEINHYIPILFTISSSDLKTASKYAMHMPRVKHFSNTNAQDSVILFGCETSKTEARIIHYLNKCDPYLTTNNYSMDQYLDRQVLVKDTVDYLAKHYKNDPPIKTADLYDKSQVLQRYFAPIKQGDSYVYKNKIDPKQFITEYIVEGLKALPIETIEPDILCKYLYLYGEPNDLNVSFNGENIIATKDGKNFDITLPASNLSFMRNIYALRATKQQNNNEEDFGFRSQNTSTVERKSQSEKFKEKYEKWKALQNKNNNPEENEK